MNEINKPTAEQLFKIDTAMKIGHVSLNVSDLQHSLDFYQRILGFKVVGKTSGERALLSAADGAPSSSYLIELLQAKANSEHDPKRVGLYHFAISLPERKYLADMLQNLRKKRETVNLDGLSDHLVSESIYLHDPDSNGIEIYRDRPVSEWKRNGNRIETPILPLNTIDLLRESTEKGWKAMPPDTMIGHVHLQVSNIARATKFYHEILGLNITSTIPSTAFFTASKYTHHHIAANTWLGADVSPASSESIGLNHFSIVLSNKAEFQRLIDHLSTTGYALIYLAERSGFIHDMDEIRIQIRYD